MANQNSHLRSGRCHSRFAMEMKGVAFLRISFAGFSRRKPIVICKPSIFVFILIARTRKGKQKSQTASGYGYRFYPEKKFIWIVVASMVVGLEVF